MTSPTAVVWASEGPTSRVVHAVRALEAGELLGAIALCGAVAVWRAAPGDRHLFACERCLDAWRAEGGLFPPASGAFAS